MIPVEFPTITFDPKFFRDIGAIEAAIDLLGRKLNDFQEPLQAALELVIIPSIKINFNTGGRPRWTSLSSPYNEQRLKRPILIQSSKMMRATQAIGNWTITRDSVQLTGIDSVPYAAYHQAGTRKMPARPFVMYQPEDITHITQIFEIWVDGLIDKHWSAGGLG